MYNNFRTAYRTPYSFKKRLKKENNKENNNDRVYKEKCIIQRLAYAVTNFALQMLLLCVATKVYSISRATHLFGNTSGVDKKSVIQFLRIIYILSKTILNTLLKYNKNSNFYISAWRNNKHEENACERTEI